MMKKFVLALIVSLCLVLPFSVNASELEKSFETSFDLPDFYDNIYSMTSYDDSGNVDGYILYSKKRKIYKKYDLDNKLVWDKSNIVVKDLDVTSDSNDNLLIKKINPDTNEVLWQKKVNGYIYRYFYSYNDSGTVDGYLMHFAANSKYSFLIPGNYIIKYDLNGNVLWSKNYDNGFYRFLNVANQSVEFYAKYGNHGSCYVCANDILSGTEINCESIGSRNSTNMLVHDNELIVVVVGGLFYTSDVKSKMLKFDITGIKTFERNLDFDFFPSAVINNKLSDGTPVGILMGLYFDDFGYAFTSYDYDGNLIWKKKLSYEPSFIAESYDETGEFNGYIVTGYDDTNKKGYITKFTYPKKVIESKNSDVEVISDAYPGKTVTVKTKEKTGYVVKRVIVRDSSGKEIEVSDDGTFVMPDDDVSIEVVYEKKVESIITNPKTSSALCVALAIISLSLLGTFIVKNKKMKGENL